ncbi:hypothetical protein TEA_010253 [Camellia sinensis var. sinensis]|uniref:Peptidase A1 domain-containing protein n=1 Tax=Camellia sinensis var. sinensis TaxID=542762 RepID=A0A4V3WM74_CAMSN|nr:hypothetical protein TEA_010253 [Camellia sinensis var. sinensis]
MAEKVLLLCIFSALCFTLVLSRSLPVDSKATLLDVSASIQKTTGVFSDSESLHKYSSQQESESLSSSFSFQLHSRSSLHRAQHKDYKLLTLARLERDSARVKSLQTRLDLAIRGITQSDLKPVDTVVFEAEALKGPCKSLDVSECRNGTCLYEVSYGDGSYTVGDFVTETITFGGSASVNNIAIGCGHNNEGLFVGAAGLIGLGGGPLSFPSQINASSFSYCLVDRDSDSTSTLEFDSVTPRNAVTAPLLRNQKLDTFFYVGLTGLSVAGELLSLPPSTFMLASNGDGGVIVDSGTAVTRLQTEAYNSLRDAFVKGTRNLPSTNGVALFDTCYDLSKMKSVEVPTLSFHFSNGKNLALPAKNYLIPVDSAGTFCFAFAPTSSSLSIIGNIQQQGTRVGFDLANSLIGFSPNEC